MLGTVSYMAPEQLEGVQVGPSADIWSLGIVLLECLTGQRVYEGSPSEIVARRLCETIPLPSDLPVAWKILFSGMLDHRPDQRLTGREVTALLATSPYSAPWVPNLTKDSDATYDLTALAPGADITLVSGPMASAGSDSTRVARPPATKVLDHRPAWRSAKTGVGALVALAVIGIGLGLWLSPSPHRDPKRTTTTTTMPSASTALSSLVSDMARAQSAGRMGTGAEQSIASSAEQALANNTAGNITQAGNDLQQAETTIVNGIQGGTITEAEGIQLLHALSVLSHSLGVAIPPTTTTTTTTSTTTTTTSTTTTTTQPFPGGPGGFGNGN